MKKILFAVLFSLVFISACRQGTVFSDSDSDYESQSQYSHPNSEIIPVSAMIEERPAEAKKYSEWDRVLRADTDMQNMYVSTPRKIEKPIDMYMAMALALKYNYSRRLVSYEQSLLDASSQPLNKIPDILHNAGYINPNNSQDINSDLKVTWNILDISTVYYQNMDREYKSSVAFEQ
ncbi:MAG: hypothetical protein LBL47_03815, partial [Lactobacillus sp.]|nr:hypothetical protein [Lactobacillus sp.]